MKLLYSKYCSILCVLLLSGSLLTQPPLDSTHMAAHSYAFSVGEDGVITGEGSNILAELAADNQFFVFGEYHGSVQLAAFTNGLFPILHQQGYKHFAIEVGPHSSKVLTELSDKPENTTSQLHRFYSEHYNTEADDIAIPFFEGKEDAVFLQKARELNFDLWGLDQEYYVSFDYFSERLLLYLPQTKALKQDHKAAQQAFSMHMKRDMEEDDYGPFTKIKKDSTISLFLGHFDKIEEAQSLIEAIKTSWDIYAYQEVNDNYSNNNQRAAYMKHNFSDYYHHATLIEESPKVFFKLGGMHSGVGRSPLAILDLGNMVSELANMNGTGAVHLNAMRRFSQQDVGITDWLAKGSRWTKGYEPLLAQARLDRWTLVDLRPFRSMLWNRQLSTSDKLAFKINHFDFMLLPPADRGTEANYNDK